MNPSEFEQKGVECSPLSKREVISISAEWVKVFFAETKSKTGKYQSTRFKWESYWSGDEPCLNGDEALTNYFENESESFYIIDESGRNGVECSPQNWPSFMGAGLDLYIFPKSLEWSMAFTHEGTT